MTTHARSALALAAALAALAGCGQAERVVETPPPTEERPIPQPDPPAAAFAVEEPGTAAGIRAIPVTIPQGKLPHDYWSVTSNTIANGGEAPASHARAGSDRTAVDAGALVLPRAALPGRIDDGGAAEGRELWLLALPVTFEPKNGFERPLARIDLALRLETGGDWTVMPIEDVGHVGLRHGPNPMPDGPFQYWFRSEQLMPALAREDGRRELGWSLKQDATGIGPAIGPGATWYAVIAAPAGAHHVEAAVTAALWFTPGAEATIVLPAQRLPIDLRPAAKRDAKSKSTAQPAAAAPAAAPSEASDANVEPQAEPAAGEAPRPAPKRTRLRQ